MMRGRSQALGLTQQGSGAISVPPGRHGPVVLYLGRGSKVPPELSYGFATCPAASMADLDPKD